MDKGPRAKSCCQPRWEFQEAWPRMTWGSRAQVCFLQRRFHKDILLNPVLVLSFCPDLSSKPGHLGTATRELLFLLDGSCVAHKACGAGCGWGSWLTGIVISPSPRNSRMVWGVLPLYLQLFLESGSFLRPCCGWAWGAERRPGGDLVRTWGLGPFSENCFISTSVWKPG